MKSILQIILLFLVSLTIYSQETTTTMSPLQRKQQLDRIHDPAIQREVLTAYLNKKGYVLPTAKAFKEKVKDHLGINSDVEQQHTLFSIVFDSKGRFINSLGESVFYYPEIEEPTYTTEEAISVLDKSTVGEQFLSYNKLFFKDDISGLPYFLKPETYEDALLLVLRMDYEKNKALFKYTISNFDLSLDYNKETLQHILFYNNPQKGFKKEVIDHLVKKYFDEELLGDFTILQSSFLKYYYQLDIPLATKDACYIYMVQKKIIYDKATEATKTNLYNYISYTAISNFVYHYGLDFIDRVKANHYYGDPEIKELVETYMIMKDPEGDPVLENDMHFLILRARVEDKDGYVNLRQAANLKSEIIGRILDREIVEVLSREDDNMWQVETTDGRQGYVHKSRLNVYVQGRK